MTLANHALQRRPAGQSSRSGDLSAIVAADRAFPATVAGALGGFERMKVFQHIKQHKTATVCVVVSYLVLYGVARHSQMLIHRVSHAGDVYYHSIDTSDRYLWSPFRFLGPISYFVFSPLRWSEAFTWRFIPRHYKIH